MCFVHVLGHGLSIFMSVKLGGLCRCHLGAFLQGALADDSEIGSTVETM